MRNSIVAKLNTALIMIMVLITLFFSGIFAYTSFQSESELLEQQVSKVIGLSVQNLSDIIWDIDLERLEKLMDSLAQQEAVRAVHVRDVTGTINSMRGDIAEYENRTDGSILERNIINDGQVIGSIRVAIDKSGIYDRIFATLRLLLYMTVFKIAIIWFFIVKLANRVIRRPLIALEHDVDVIAKGDFTHSVGSSLTRSDEIGLFAKRFEEMRISIADKMKIIEFQNKSLERKVNERTIDLQRRANDLRAVFDSSDQVTLIIERDLNILDASKKATELLPSLGSHGNLLERFISASNLSESEQSILISVIRTSLNNDPINFDINASALPVELLINVEGTRVPFQMNWGYVLDASNQVIEKIILTGRDISLHKDFEQYQQSTEKRLQVMAELIGVGVAKARRDIDQYDGLAHAMKRSIQGGESLEKYLGNLHTAKGNFRISGLKILANSIHNLEGTIKNDSQSYQLMTLEGCLELNSYYHEILEKIENDTDGSRNLVNVIRARLESGKAISRTWLEGALEAQERNFCFLSTLEKDLGQMVESTAAQLGKPVPQIEFRIDDDTYVPPGIYDVLRTCCLHLSSNSLAHGIESAEIRRQYQKNLEGQINLFIGVGRSQIKIQYWDDGQGIDNQLFAADQGGRPPTPEKIRDLIFEKGFSSASHLTEISGRGIGMSEIREQLESIGASIDCYNHEVVNEGHTGIRFLIKVPLVSAEERKSS